MDLFSKVRTRRATYRLRDIPSRKPLYGSRSCADPLLQTTAGAKGCHRRVISLFCNIFIRIWLTGCGQLVSGCLKRGRIVLGSLSGNLPLRPCDISDLRTDLTNQLGFLQALLLFLFIKDFS